MPTVENAAADAAAGGYQAWGAGAGTVIGAAIVYVVQVFRGRKNGGDQPGKQLILEHADQADLAVVKDLSEQLKAMIVRMGDIADFRDDIEETKRNTMRMAALLEKLEQRFSDLERKALSDESFRRGQEAERARRESERREGR